MRFTLEKHLENTWKNDPEKLCEPWGNGVAYNMSDMDAS